MKIISEYYVNKKHKNFKISQDLTLKISHVKNMINFIIREQFFDNELYNEFLRELCGKDSSEYKLGFRYLNINEKEIYNLLKNKSHTFKENGIEYKNYFHELPKNIVQQTIRQLSKTWKGYFKTIKKNNADKNGKKVGIPGYNKNHKETVIISKNDFVIRYYLNYKNYIKRKQIKLKAIKKLPKNIQDKIRTEIIISPSLKNGNSLLLEKGIYFVNEIKIIPKMDNTFCYHLVYEPNLQFFNKHDELNVIQSRRKHQKLNQDFKHKNKNILVGIDLGVRNIVTLTIQDQSDNSIVKIYQVKKEENKNVELITNKIEEATAQKDQIMEESYKELALTKPIKDDLKDNQKPYGWYNSTLDFIQQHNKTEYDEVINLQDFIKMLWVKKEKVMKTQIHALSSKIAQICIIHNVSKLIIGKNEEMKQDMKGKSWNQYPHAKLVKMIQYKLDFINKEHEIQEESYTSKSSYFDSEPFEHNYHYSGKRVNEYFYRFRKMKSGKKVEKRYDSDVQGSLNIIRKNLIKNNGKVKKPVGEFELPLARKLRIHCSLTT